MATTARQETMLRKPILMPPSMIAKVDTIAKSKHVSFAKVVRDAVNAFDNEASNDDDAKILAALAETMIQTTQEVIEKIDAIENKLDNTHALLMDQQ